MNTWRSIPYQFALALRRRCIKAGFDFLDSLVTTPITNQSSLTLLIRQANNRPIPSFQLDKTVELEREIERDSERKWLTSRNQDADDSDDRDNYHLSNFQYFLYEDVQH